MTFLPLLILMTNFVISIYLCFRNNSQSAPPVYKPISSRQAVIPSNAVTMPPGGQGIALTPSRSVSKGSQAMKRPRILSISAPITR